MRWHHLGLDWLKKRPGFVRARTDLSYGGRQESRGRSREVRADGSPYTRPTLAARKRQRRARAKVAHESRRRNRA